MLLGLFFIALCLYLLLVFVASSHSPLLCSHHCHAFTVVVLTTIMIAMLTITIPPSLHLELTTTLSTNYHAHHQHVVLIIVMPHSTTYCVHDHHAMLTSYALYHQQTSTFTTTSQNCYQQLVLPCNVYGHA